MTMERSMWSTSQTSVRSTGDSGVRANSMSTGARKPSRRLTYTMRYDRAHTAIEPSLGGNPGGAEIDKVEAARPCRGSCEMV